MRPLITFFIVLIEYLLLFKGLPQLEIVNETLFSLNIYMGSANLELIIISVPVGIVFLVGSISLKEALGVGAGVSIMFTIFSYLVSIIFFEAIVIGIISGLIAAMPMATAAIVISCCRKDENHFISTGY